MVTPYTGYLLAHASTSLLFSQHMNPCNLWTLTDGGLCRVVIMVSSNMLFRGLEIQIL